MNKWQLKIYNKAIRCNKATTDKRINDVGSNLFVGNLAPEVDEKMLYDTFSQFGGLISTPKVKLRNDLDNERPRKW